MRSGDYTYIMNLEASQANLVYKYKNIKVKVIRTNLNIKFNRRCLNSNITPKFASVNINNNSVGAIKAKYIAQKTWLKEEIKQLYIKKNKLNQLLCKAHLEILNMLRPVMVNKRCV